jgi:predicted enzyme related to lactoylglutathione lyase
MSNTLGGAIPIFCVADVAAGVEHYVTVFGFQHDWGDERFASVSRHRCHIFLSRNHQGRPGAWTWIGVNDADELAAEFRARGAKIRNPPTNYPWAYEMQVEDPDGNVLRFGSSTKQGEPFGQFLDMHGRFWPPLGE